MKSFEEIKDLLPKTTTLYYVDRNDSLDEHTIVIQDCIDNKNGNALQEAIDEWYQEYPHYEFESLDKELISDICNKFEIEEEEAEEILEEFRDEINDHYYNVDESNVLKDLVCNSSSIAVRIPLYSNYDCINSHYFEDSYSYKETYFGDMVDVLNLNPAKVKKMLLENNVKVYGSFPNCKNRDGKEYVSYSDFWQELENSSCGANLLVFTGLLNVNSLLESNFDIKEVTIPKGNNCGIFSDFQGGGSVLSMELLRDYRKFKCTKKKEFNTI